MEFEKLRNTVSVASVCIATIIAICFPAVYAFDTVARAYYRLDTVARMSAADAVTLANGSQKSGFWSPRDLLFHAAMLDGVSIEITDASGARISSAGVAPAALHWPVLTVSTPVQRSDAAIGTVQASQSLRPMLPRLAAAVLVCALLALIIDLVMRRMSLVPLRDALEKLAAVNGELATSNAQLRKQADMLSEAQEIGKIAYWTYSQADRQFTWSPAMYTLLGRTPETLDLKPRALSAIGVGEARRTILEAQRKALETGVIETADVKLVRGDGSIGCFSMVCKPLTDASGHCIGLEGTLQDITERAHAEARLLQLVHFDPLTGLPNRSVARVRLTQAIANAADGEGLSALMLIDLDNFKDVNDTLGHAAGDALLVDVVGRIGDVLSSEDFFARLGGDEFAVILTNITTEQDIEGAALRVLAAVSGDVELDAGTVTIGTSIGIAVIGRDGRTPDDVMRNADLALYRSKSNGRATVSFFEPSLDEEMQRKARLVRDLQQSLNDGRGLDLHYQPQADLVTGRVMGFEALLRWTHPDHGPIPPGEFIPIAERSRLICDLGAWVLRKAVRQARIWQLEGGPEREVAVNVSPAQIMHSDLLADVDQALAETGLSPHLLCLELTESLMNNPDDARLRDVLCGLKARGVSLALDDFGTGYSSLGRLSELPFDRLKIDRAFVSSLAGSPYAPELLKGIITLGRGLRMKVHVEGMENIEEIRTVCEFAADFAQGFGIARPMTADKAMAFARACDTNEICEDLLELVDDGVAAAA